MVNLAEEINCNKYIANKDNSGKSYCKILETPVKCNGVLYKFKTLEGKEEVHCAGETYKCTWSCNGICGLTQNSERKDCDGKIVFEFSENEMRGICNGPGRDIFIKRQNPQTLNAGNQNSARPSLNNNQSNTNFAMSHAGTSKPAYANMPKKDGIEKKVLHSPPPVKQETKKHFWQKNKQV
jgi:hypothetical protein